ncbi:MAG: NAD(P)-binding domain-containing protein, partial [Sulfitobacter sp.]|nr:NAD(P)-binding domain-containing protein [Sulfitobacter sp.]
MSRPHPMKLAVLGLGLMGGTIALRLKNLGLEVVGWNRSPEKARSLAEEGLATTDSPADAVAQAELVILTLSD